MTASPSKKWIKSGFGSPVCEYTFTTNSSEAWEVELSSEPSETDSTGNSGM